MTDEDATHPVHLSHAALAKATAVSLVIAALGLVLVVLPASYGIDPTGLGSAMGLAPAPNLPADLSTPSENVTIVLDPGASISRSHTLAEGQTIRFTWSADAPLNMTLRGSGGPATQEGTLTATGRPTTGGTATLEIPADGTYVWTWENPGQARTLGSFDLGTTPPQEGQSP